MKNWLKDNPFYQMIINGFISFLIMLIMFFLSNRETTNAALITKVDKIDKEKATFVYVDDENEKQDKRNRDNITDLKTDLNQLKADNRNIISLLVTIKDNNKK